MLINTRWCAEEEISAPLKSIKRLLLGGLRRGTGGDQNAWRWGMRPTERTKSSASAWRWELRSTERIKSSASVRTSFLSCPRVPDPSAGRSSHHQHEQGCKPANPSSATGRCGDQYRPRITSPTPSPEDSGN